MLVEKMQRARSLSSYLLNFENIEVLVAMCALVHFVRDCTAAEPYAEINAVSSGLQSGKGASLYVAVAETLIMRLQDALDEDEIGGFGSPAGQETAEVDAEFKIVLAKAGKSR